MLYQAKKSNSKLKSPTQGIKYSSKEYSNPFFDKKKKGRAGVAFYVSWKVKLGFGLLALFLVSLALTLVYLPYFKITNVEISGQGKIDENIIREIVDTELGKNFYAFLPGSNIFVFNQGHLKEKLEEKFVFQELLITSKLPNKLKVSYIEEKYAIIYEEDELYFYTDEEGNVIEEVSVLEINQKLYPILKNKSSEKMIDREIRLEKNLLAYTINAFRVFQDQASSDFKLSHFQANNDRANKFWMVLEDGPIIYLNAKLDFSTQLQKLKIIKDEKLKENFSDKKYIDLRFGDSIYFR